MSWPIDEPVSIEEYIQQSIANQKLVKLCTKGMETYSQNTEKLNILFDAISEILDSAQGYCDNHKLRKADNAYKGISENVRFFVTNLASSIKYKRTSTEYEEIWSLSEGGNDYRKQLISTGEKIEDKKIWYLPLKLLSNFEPKKYGLYGSGDDFSGNVSWNVDENSREEYELVEPYDRNIEAVNNVDVLCVECNSSIELYSLFEKVDESKDTSTPEIVSQNLIYEIIKPDGYEKGDFSDFNDYFILSKNREDLVNTCVELVEAVWLRYINKAEVLLANRTTVIDSLKMTNRVIRNVINYSRKNTTIELNETKIKVLPNPVAEGFMNSISMQSNIIDSRKALSILKGATSLSSHDYLMVKNKIDSYDNQFLGVKLTKSSLKSSYPEEVHRGIKLNINIEKGNEKWVETKKVLLKKLDSGNEQLQNDALLVDSKISSKDLNDIPYLKVSVTRLMEWARKESLNISVWLNDLLLIINERENLIKAL